MDRKVITLGGDKFSKACKSLQTLVESAGFEPDAIMGIQTGGTYVAVNMFDKLPHFNAGLKRQNVTLKIGWKARIIKALPRFIQNALRIIESAYLEYCFKQPDIVPLEPDRIDSLPDNVKKLLIVDDAVDSGLTLARTIAGIRKAYPGIEIKSAVLTVTTKRPLVEPDFCVFERGTLLRSPWAVDFKNSDK